MPPQEFDAEMKQCIQHAEAMQQQGRLISFEQLEAPDTARSVRIRKGRVTVVDGPFAETKEMLAGFNLVEAASMEDAVRMAQEDFPWARYGCVEVRPVRDIAAVQGRAET